LKGVGQGVFISVCIIGVAGLVLNLAYQFDRKIAIQNESRKQVICPALLSIGRSARDTLIVMKAESLCNSFVLDNLK
jgi:hypothetical protein